MKLIGNKIYLRFLETADAEAMLDLNVKNRDFFEAYVSVRDEAFFFISS